MPDPAARRDRPAGASGAVSTWRAPSPETVRAGILVAGLLGAVLLFVAEFTTLFYVHSATSSTPVKSVSTGSHQTYALIPIALVAATLAIAVLRFGSRPALLALGALGVLTLLIALVGDLPDAQATGLIGTPTTHYVTASSTPSAGLYMETFGAVLLLATSGVGFLLLGAPDRGKSSRAAARR
jgi:hypothetical protein